jgi:hypothetical protein
MRKSLWLIPAAVFFLNPGFACSDEPQFQYGAAEMRAVVAGDWSFTITPDGGAASQVTVHIDQAATAPGTAAAAVPARSVVRAANACGTRTLVKGAGACIDVTQLPLTVTFVEGDSSFSNAALSGDFSVYGLAFATGNLDVVLGSYHVALPVNADGSLGDAHLVPAGTVTVSR